jgi:nucleotide-binding universal stress UspA family protein
MASPTFVVPLDSSAYSERALPVATALAQRAGGRLLLVSVQDHGPLRPREYLDEIAACPRPVPVETVGISDMLAADAIVKVVSESDDRIVCMTSHGRGGLRWGLVGSVAEEVVRRADRPALLIGRHCREDFLTDARYLLAAVDGPEATARLARPVIDWAERLGLELQAATVVHPLDVESADHPEKVLEPIIEELGGADHATATLLVATYPQGALADHAADIGAAIIAASSHCRTGLSRFAIGSTTMGLVHQAPCPVLVAPWTAKGATP